MARSTRPSKRGSERRSSNRSCACVAMIPPRSGKLTDKPYRIATASCGKARRHGELSELSGTRTFFELSGTRTFSRKSTCPHSPPSRKSTCPHSPPFTSVLVAADRHRRRSGAALLLPEIGLAGAVAGHRLVEGGGVVEPAVQHHLADVIGVADGGVVEPAVQHH